MATPPLSRVSMLEVLDALAQAGSQSAAARMLGIPRETFRSRLAKAQEAGLHLSSGAQMAVDHASLSGVEAKAGWRVIQHEDGSRDSVYWRAPEVQAEDAADRIRSILEGLSPAEPIKAPRLSDADLCTVYPIADRHQGMRAWAAETGSNYDNRIASDRLKEWIGRCVASSPAAETAVILDVGDGEHIDDQTNATPKSKNQLDVDSRVFMTLESSIKSLAYSVDLALHKHRKVIVRILPGNHNPTLYMATMFALAERYRNEPRVDVQKVPGEFFIYQFGRCMLAAHHGDKSKPERTVMALADNHASIWGATYHRFLWTGHLHHAKAQDIGGVHWMQLRAMCERDAHAVASSYTGRAQLVAITLHKNDGEIMRVSVNA